MKDELIVLGTGTCVSSFNKPFDFRYPAGYLLKHNNTLFLLDCSEGTRERLEKIKIDYFDINSIFITHFHPDHFMIDSLLQSIFVRANWAKTTRKITIYGPKHIEDIFIDGWNNKTFPNFYEKRTKDILNIAFCEFQNEKKITVDDFSLTPFSVFHQDGLMECYTFRFVINNAIICYSGDTGTCLGIEKASQDADLFICESNANIGEDQSQKSGHLNPYQAGLIARKSGVKKLVLTHYTGKDSEEDMKREVFKSGFSNSVTIAHDFDTLVF